MPTPSLGFGEFSLLSRRAQVLIALPAIAVILVAFWIAAQFLRPVPPRQIVLAVGPAGSTLHRMAERFRSALAADGIIVELRSTQGTGENLRLLVDRASGVDAGFVVAGTAAQGAQGLVNVSNLAHVALWALARRDAQVTTLAELRGRTVAVGLPQSGLALALEPLLTANGITADNTRLLHLPDAEALARFTAGEIDVVFSPDGGHSRLFNDAAASDGAALVDFVRADAYAQRFPHLQPLTLAAGSIDFVRNIPARPVSLVGSTLMLVAHEDLHPTIVDLLVDASRQGVGPATYFDRPGQFPNLARVDEIPVSEQALTYHRAGPSFLRRYLPLWLADFLQRLFTLAIPVFAVVLPIGRLVPFVVGQVIAARVYRCYAELRRLESEEERGTRPPAEVLVEVDALAERVRKLRLPLRYMDAQFALRRNVDHARSAMRNRMSRLPEAGRSNDATSPHDSRDSGRRTT